MPSLRFEREAGEGVAGIDEAGRGPLAGPVVAAAVVFAGNAVPRGLARAIDDSKKLTPEVRSEIAAKLWALRAAGRAWIGVGAASAEVIDQINILQATFLAMRRAVDRLGTAPRFALVDGNRLPQLPCAARAVVDGDALCLSIAAASIVAKVARDHAMQRLARRYPPYGWESNAGYPTAYHLAALAAHGPSPHHRVTFGPLRQGQLGLDAPVDDSN